jgi:hypothetical protein
MAADTDPQRRAMLGCPGCGNSAGAAAPARCGGCGLWLGGPLAAELRLINAELARVEDVRGQLVGRRLQLLAEVEREQPPGSRGEQGSPEAGAHASAAGPVALPPKAPSGTGTRPELSPRAVANLLLLAGGLLVGIAAVVFTVANWGSIGTGGRAAILLALSVLALSAPWPLASRGLTATGESAAAIGLALTVLDAYMVQLLVLPGAPRAVTAGHAAVASAVLAAGWAAYSLAAPPRVPRLAAIVLAQLPLSLAAVAVAPSRASVALALLVTAAGDLILLAWASRCHAHAERLTAAAAGAMTWLIGVVLTLTVVFPVPDQRGSLRGGGELMLAAVIGLAGASLARQSREAASTLAGVSGALIVVGLALPAAVALPGPWAVGVFAAFAAAGAGAAWQAAARQAGHGGKTAALLGTVSRPAAAGAAAVLGVAGLLVSPAALSALLDPLTWAGRTWAGPPASARAALSAAVAWHGSPATPVVLGLVSLACSRAAALPRSFRGAAIAIAALACATVPVAADMPYWAAIVTLSVLAAVLLGVGAAVTDRMLAGTASAAGLAVGVIAAAWSLTTPATTIEVLAVLLASGGIVAVAARSALAAMAGTAQTVAAAAGLALAVPLASGLPVRQTGLAVLGAAGLAQLAAALLARRRSLTSLTAEMSGWLAAVAGVAATFGRPGTASLGLLVLGTLCLGVATRPDRQHLLWAGLASLDAALCVWLAAAGVHAPEPYTVPVAAAAIAFGWQRMRRSPGTGSWAAYGPGLAIALLPSLVVAWQGQGWIRPMLLCLAAAAVTLAGVRSRLAAPLLLGTAVAVTGAGRELAPALTRLAGMLPGWVPIAVIGIALLAAGATYEARLRDLRRLRAALSRLR